MTQPFSLTRILAVVTAAVLTACGGGGGSGGGTTVASDPPAIVGAGEAVPLSSTANVQSTLAGVALRSNGSTGASDLTTASGTLVHSTGATTLNDGTFELVDPDGRDANGVLRDGTASARVGNSALFSGSYAYVTPYTENYTAGGTVFDSTGFFGTVTNVADMPGTGSATFTGEASAQIATAAAGVSLTGGTSTVRADFANAVVDVSLVGFTASDPVTGAGTASPIDRIAVTGMRINGARYSGGLVATTLGGAAVNLTGAGTTTAAQGAFFGLDSSRPGPDETAGVILVTGESGVVSGAFIAD